MIDLKKYGLTPSDKTSIQTSDLICIANLEKTTNVDTTVIEVEQNNKLTIKGEYVDIIGKLAVVGSDLIKIINTEIKDKNTIITYEKEMLGVLGEHTVGNHFRTVVILDESDDIVPISWEFSDSLGSVSSSLFPVELSGGNVTIKSDLQLWSPLSERQKYKVRNRKTMVYIFKGMNGSRFLKFSTVVNKVKFNTRGKRESNKIILDIKTKLAQWFEKDVALNQQLKGTTPKEFFKMAFNLNDDEVYYAEGVEESSFPQLNNLHTKEYKKMSELLKAYCQNGIRFCFDRLERVKIFGDFKVDTIETERVLDYDITDSMLSEDDQMIYNTIDTKSVQRQTLYNFEDLDKKYVKFFKVKRNAVNSKKFLRIAENGDYDFAPLEIIDDDVRASVQLKDYVLFKRTAEPFDEFYGRVLAIDSDRVHIVPILYDKDYKLFNYGKNKYLYDLMIGRSCEMDLYYVREELPMVFKLTRKKGNEEVDSSLMLPLLPKVDGETKYKEEFNATFGSASNLKVGKYTGITEEVDSIYGVWDNSKLLYNMEMTQFSNEKYPPIFVLSNKVQERLIDDRNPILNYTHFDNSDLLLEIERPNESNKCDAVLKIQNTKSINKDIDLYVDKEISRMGNKILEVESLTPYKLGDVLILNKPDNLTPQEEVEYDEVLSTMKWTITHKEAQRTLDGEFKNYIYVDTPFAKRQKVGEVYEFTRFPNTSIVYLQELYFRGNPVIEFSQDIVGISKGVSFEGSTSKDLYGEKKYELDSKQLNKENLRLLMGYILDNFQATTPKTTKYNVPISVFNALDLELLDVVRINDPIYTQIKDDMKWVILEISAKSKTNEIQLKLLNLNAKNTKPYKIDIKDVIEYKPIEIPTYDHSGGEGNTKSNDDGSGGTNEDKTLGQFWLAEVDTKKFRAKVEKFENNYIYFKDFNGEEVEEYKSKLFPVGEFAINIKGEVIFVQSDSNYRAYIKKRQVYDTEEAFIAPEDDIKFLVTTTYVDIDGTLYGRKAMFGDGDNYLSVDPIKGVKIVGDFVVGDNNKNPNNDLWKSLQNNRTFQQDERPVNTPSYMLKDGDIWYDKDDENHAYRYDGKVWVSARDGSIVSTHNTVFVQSDEPTEKDGRPLVDGDTWYNSNEGNKPSVYKDGKWIVVTDMTLQKAIDEVEKQANVSTKKIEDMADDEKITPNEKKQVALEMEQIRIEFPKYMDESSKLGLQNEEYKRHYNFLNNYIIGVISDTSTTTSIDRDSFTEFFKNYYNARQDLVNAISSKVKQLADRAQADATTALGNAKIFYQPTQPTQGMKENDLWYNTAKQNEPYVYKNGGWQSARDKIYETEGGNKVYFQGSQPPTSGKGVKEGDQWFDTGHNNNQYVLLKKQSGRLEWEMASNALDKINKGEVVINGNTTFNGDATIISEGKEETTIIKGGSITFTRNGYPVSVIRNMQIGEIETDSKGKGIISFPRFKNMSLLLSIKSFAIGQNVRSLGCYANVLNAAENKYQCFLYGTEAGLGNGTAWSTGWGNYTIAYTHECVGIGVSSIHIKAPSVSFTLSRSSRHSFPPISDLWSDGGKLPSVNIKILLVGEKEIKVLKTMNDVYFSAETTKTYQEEIPPSRDDDNFGEVISYREGRIYLDKVISVDANETSFQSTKKTIKVEITFSNRTYWYKLGHSGYSSYHREKRDYNSPVQVSMNGSYTMEKIEKLTGHGTLFYMAVEN